MDDNLANRGMLSVIKLFKCGDGSKKDDDTKKNACDKCGEPDCDGTCVDDKDEDDVVENACGDNKKDEDKKHSIYAVSSGIKYNEDGTLPVDIFRTGTWGHPWYGNVVIDEKYIDSLISNFENNIVGNKVAFDYHHDHRKNFGIPIKLRKEPRNGVFVKRPFTMLVADVRLTSDGKADVEGGQVLNFSSEISDDYIHREMMPVGVINDNGDPVLNEDGTIMEKYIARRYGPTLMGGAVTNNPFITELNPNGLGGNLSAFKLSIDGGLMVANPRKLSVDNLSSMCFSSSDEQPKNEPSKDNLGLLASLSNEEFESISCDSLVVCDGCLYDSREFRAGDAALPDSAYAIIYEIKGKSDKMLKVRKLPHHTKSISGPDDNSSLEIPRLKNALARINQTDAPASDIKTALAHLNKHADATYRKKETKSSSSPMENVEMDTGNEPGTAGAAVEQAKTFSSEDVQSSVAKALADQRVELDRQFATIREENAKLKSVADQESIRAYCLEVDSFIGKFASGKASPAFQNVVRNTLLGNKDMTIRYFSEKDNSYSNITLNQLFEKISECADFESVVVSSSEKVVTAVQPDVTTGNSAPKSTSDKSLSIDDVKELAKDPVKFAKFMTSHSSSVRGFAFKSQTTAPNKEQA